MVLSKIPSSIGTDVGKAWAWEAAGIVMDIGTTGNDFSHCKISTVNCSLHLLFSGTCLVVPFGRQHFLLKDLMKFSTVTKMLRN